MARHRHVAHLSLLKEREEALLAVVDHIPRTAGIKKPASVAPNLGGEPGYYSHE